MNTSTIYNCLFCYASIRSYHKQNEDLPTLQQIISSCNNHLKPEFVAGINWKSVSSVNGILCHECYIIVEKLVSLADQLDIIRKEIKDLDTNLVKRVLRKRRDNEHQSSISYNVGDSVKESRASKKDDQLNGSQTYFPEDNFIADYADVQVNLVNYRADDEITPEIHDGSNSSINYDADLSADETAYNEDEPVASHESISKDEVGTKKKSVKKRTNPEDSAVAKPKIVILASELRRHLENKDIPGYECEKCHKRFSRLSILHRHDCSNPTFECEVCKISFSGTGSLKLHMRCHTGEKPFKCETCGKCFAIKHHLETHLRIHTGERPFKCDICKKTFREQGRCSRHVLAVHETGKKLFKCDICSKSYHSFTDLKQHLLYHREDKDRAHKCVTCGKGFVSKSNLKQHHIRVNYHSGENPFKCEICEKGFANNNSLLNHMKRHGEKFLCEECGKYFATNVYLAIHMLTHTEKGPFICETCGKTYPSSVRLKEHIKFFHNERAIKCTNCGKVFKCQPEFLKHQKALACEGPPFKCAHCDKSFARNAQRERHQIMEHMSENERPTIACKQCPKIFHLRRDLHGHVRKVHSAINMKVKVHCQECNRDLPTKKAYKCHKREEEVKCKKCPQQFTSSCEYSIHRREVDHPKLKKKNHKKIVPCTMCELSFVGRRKLRAHMKSSHPKKTTTKGIGNEEPNGSSESSRARLARNRKRKLKTDLLTNGEESDSGTKKMYNGFNSSDDEILEIKKEEDLSLLDSEIQTEIHCDE